MLARSFLSTIVVAVLAACSCLAKDVVLQWNKNAEPDIAGYRLYYGTASRACPETMDVGTSTTATILDVVPGRTYFFVVTAYNVFGESDYSKAVIYKVTPTPTPKPSPSPKPTVTPTPTPSPTPPAPTPSPTPTPPPPIPTPAPSFVKAINVNGSAAIINGNTWQSFTGALASGFATTNPAYTTNLTFTPAVDSATNAMLNTGIWCPACDVNFTQALPNGNYLVYLWAVENHESNFRSYDVKLEGLPVAFAIGRLAKNAWARYGPYRVTVNDGTLTVTLGRVTGDPLVQGIEIWSAGPP